VNLRLFLKPSKLLSVAKARLASHRSLNQSVSAGVARFKNDPNYRPDLIPIGFAPHPGPEQDDSAIIARIITAYKKAKIDQQFASETFNVSNEWLPIYERILGPVMQALHREDIPTLKKMYANFFRDPCSHGLSGWPRDLQNKLFSSNSSRKLRDVALVDFLHRFDLWKRRTNHAFTVQELVTPLIGNPYGFIADGVFLRGGVDYQHYYAQAINSTIAPKGQNIVLELGGGFGGMAYFLLRDNPLATYIDFDLPETLALASYFLLKAFPELPVVLYGEAELSAEILTRSRIVMMPSFQINKMASKSVDFAFNSYSLAEMSPPSIREYIAEITRCTRGHFLHVNHNKNSVVSADNFGIEDHGFRLLHRELAGWTLGLNPASDEFEYLYQAE
jgi:putative sugar O-methyltransferase